MTVGGYSCNHATWDCCLSAANTQPGTYHTCGPLEGQSLANFSDLVQKDTKGRFINYGSRGSNRLKGIHGWNTKFYY